MYAERGLVTNGMLSKTFTQLYYLFCSIPIIFQIIPFLKEDILYDRCSNILDEPIELTAFKKLGYSACIMNLFFLHLLYFRSSKFVWSKSKDSKKPPAIVGRFQRNVLTFKDTVIIVTIVIMKIMPSFFLSNIYLNYSYLNLFLNIVLTIGVGIIFPSCIIHNLENTIPDFFSNSHVAKTNNKFYIRKTYIEPRRDLTLSDISNLQFITWRSRRTQRCFLSDDCKCNRCKVTRLPKIIIVDECNEIISVQNYDKRNN